MIRCFLSVFLLLIFSLHGLLQSDELYVSAKQAEVRDHPTRKAQEDPILPRGTKVESTKYKKKWHQISFVQDSENKTGWIYSGKLSPNLPEEDGSLVAANGNKLSGEDIAAGKAIRGVGPLAQKFANANRISTMHKKYLDYHHSFISMDKNFQPKVTEQGITPRRISAADIHKFLKEGKIGEFSESMPKEGE
ncbi:MAG: hypothetical protein HUU50_11950 [Candidatus Brocadiae bacterium]|nr:hypothetical protein [Candidatus Brocadiia bacterium]